MKLLLDENLSPSLCDSLRGLYEAAVHVRDVGLDEATDITVWEYAKKNGFAILSKDSDFNHLSLLHGFPPKVVWVALGNCSTKDIEFVLQARRSDLMAFSADSESAVLILGPTPMDTP